MGEFVAMTALRTGDMGPVLDAVIRYARMHGVPAEPAEDGDETAVHLWPARDGWVVLDWPRFFSGLAPATQWLSREFETLASAIDVYDGDFWNHLLYRDGDELDRFSSWPDHFRKDRHLKVLLRRELAGRPDVIAEAFGVPVGTVAPYLVPPYSSGVFGWWLRRRKPFPDDECVLADIWVFTDFWRRLGIPWPETEKPTRAVRLPGPGHAALPGGGPTM